MATIDVREIIFGMPSRFAQSKANGLVATIQFIIEGEGGGDFLLRLDNGICLAEERRCESPTLMLKMSRKTYIEMALGKLKGPQAFFTRKLRYKGDIKLLMKMHALFPVIEKEDIEERKKRGV